MSKQKPPREYGTPGHYQLIMRELGRPGDPWDISKWRPRFWAFHKANPGVYSLILEMCDELRTKRPDHPRIGIDVFIGRVRWEVIIRTVDADSDYKINDAYAAYYARLVIRDHPSWDGMFEMREMRR